MLNVYIPACQLEELCINEMSKPTGHTSNDWFLLLAKQKVIYLDKEHPLDDIDDPLFCLSQSYGKLERFEKASVDYSNTDVGNSNFLINSKEDILLLDISGQQAQTFQQNYGIICQSTRNLSKCALADSQHIGHYTLEEGEKRSWKELLEPVKSLPSNAIVFNDRYLMSRGTDAAIENIKQILNELLPCDELKQQYQVLIVLDRLNKNNDEFTDLATRLNKLKCNNLNRQYAKSIRVELLVINTNAPGHKNTHDRRILSNYYIIKASLQLNAFNNLGKSHCAQGIDVTSAYSYGLRDKSDPPSKAMRMMARQLGRLVSDAKKAKCQEDVCSVWINGKKAYIGEIKNRLIMS